MFTCLLYPKPALARALALDPTLSRKVWTLLNDINMAECRVYGGSLHKLEPNELANVKADASQALLPVAMPEPFVQTMLFESVE